MSDDRINGMIWGFSIGVGVEASIFVHPIMIVFAILAFAGSYASARRNAVVGGSRDA